MVWGPRPALASTTVAVVGAGGLGRPIVDALASDGIGVALILVTTLRWRVVPLIAAHQVEAGVWTMAPPVVADDLERDKELLKVIRISMLDYDRTLMDVVCKTDGNGGTVLKFLVHGDLSSGEIGVVKDFIERVKRCGDELVLTRRPVGLVREP